MVHTVYNCTTKLHYEWSHARYILHKFLSKTHIDYKVDSWEWTWGGQHIKMTLTSHSEHTCPRKWLVVIVIPECWYIGVQGGNQKLIHVQHIPILIVLCVGESKAPQVLYPSCSTVYMGHAQHSTARHMITVIVFGLSYTRNKADKMQSNINQLKHGKVCPVHGVVSINHKALGYVSCCVWLSQPHPSYHYDFLLCFN